jgi:hypothetical protein
MGLAIRGLGQRLKEEIMVRNRRVRRVPHSLRYTLAVKNIAQSRRSNVRRI